MAKFALWSRLALFSLSRYKAFLYPSLSPSLFSFPSKPKVFPDLELVLDTGGSKPAL